MNPAGCKYGFFGEQFSERATIVSEISDDDLTLIPYHNLDCERDLAISGIHIENYETSTNTNETNTRIAISNLDAQVTL